MVEIARGRRTRLAAEAALAYAVGGAVFALVSVTIVTAGSGAAAGAFGVVCLGAVVAVARRWGIAYASPAAFATLIAFDWFCFPPTHAHEIPAPGDLASLFA